MSPKAPKPPEWLSDEARAVWDGLAAELRAGADRDALVVYCCAVADFTRAQRLLDQTGQVIQGRRGGLVRSPLNIVKAENAATIRALARQLGLVGGQAEPEAPSARSFRNQAAAERTVAALRRGGRVEEVDSASVALVRHLASALDRVDPARHPAQVASLARSYANALRLLRGEDDNDQPSTGVEELLALLSSPVGDGSEP